MTRLKNDQYFTPPAIVYPLLKEIQFYADSLYFEPCPHCWGDTETIDFPQLTHPVIVCLDCGAMEYTKPENLENAEKIFTHNLFTDVNCYASPGTPNLGHGDRP